MNRRNFLKFLAKGAAIVGATGVLGLPEVKAKKFDTDGIINKLGEYANSLNNIGISAKEAANAMDILSGNISECDSSDDVEWDIEYSTQSGTHWPNDTCQTVLAGDMITTDGGVTWTTLELGLDEDDKITRLDYIFGQIYLETLKDRYFLSEDCENFIEYYPDNYYIKVKES